MKIKKNIEKDESSDDLKDIFSDKTLLQIIDCKIDMSNNYKDEIIKLISS